MRTEHRPCGCFFGRVKGSFCNREKFGAYMRGFGAAALGVDGAFPPATCHEQPLWTVFVVPLQLAGGAAR